MPLAELDLIRGRPRGWQASSLKRIGKDYCDHEIEKWENFILWSSLGENDMTVRTVMDPSKDVLS